MDYTALCKYAAELFDVSAPALMDGLGRSQDLCDARQALAWVLQKHHYTTVEIGKMLHRHHTTISHALKLARRRIVSDPRFSQLLEELASAAVKPLEPPLLPAPRAVGAWRTRSTAWSGRRCPKRCSWSRS